MKKLYILILGIILSVPMFALDITLRVPTSLQQTYVESSEVGTDMVYGYGLEVGQDLYLVQVGGGMNWDASSYAPAAGYAFRNRLMYGYVKVNLFPVVFRPYVVGKFGTSTLMGLEGYTESTTEGGAYTAFGLGIDIFNLQGEMLYSTQSLKLDGVDETLAMLSLVIGVKIF